MPNPKNVPPNESRFCRVANLHTARAPRTCLPTATALLRIAPVGMTEVLFWRDTVADELLEFLQLGEALTLLARP